MSGHDFASSLRNLRQLASTAARTGTTSSAPDHPDAELLKLCADVLDLHAEEERFSREASGIAHGTIANPAYRAVLDNRDACAAAWKPLLARIGKIPSKTPAGVYAKAMVLRRGYGTAPKLSLSLAEDLVACPGLRSSIWPAGGEA
jgi:hypothetical protein